MLFGPGPDLDLRGGEQCDAKLVSAVALRLRFSCMAVREEEQPAPTRRQTGSVAVDIFYDSKQQPLSGLSLRSDLSRRDSTIMEPAQVEAFQILVLPSIYFPV